jgi:hypothetical protein
MAKFKRNEPLNNLSASLENYLETISILKREKKYARIGAKALNVKSLRESSCVTSKGKT